MTTKTIKPIDAQEMLKKNEAYIIDVRDINEFNAENIETAANIPLSSIICSEINDKFGDKTTIIQCLTGKRAEIAYNQLKKENPNKSYLILEGGIKGWADAGLPTNKSNKKATISLMRQVQIVVGGCVLLGSIASLFNNGFIWIPLFFGAGLLFAGLSGFCGMMLLLEKAPWNK